MVQGVIEWPIGEHGSYNVHCEQYITRVLTHEGQSLPLVAHDQNHTLEEAVSLYPSRPVMQKEMVALFFNAMTNPTGQQERAIRHIFHAMVNAMTGETAYVAQTPKFRGSSLIPMALRLQMSSTPVRITYNQMCRRVSRGRTWELSMKHDMTIEGPHGTMPRGLFFIVAIMHELLEIHQRAPHSPWGAEEQECCPQLEEITVLLSPQHPQHDHVVQVLTTGTPPPIPPSWGRAPCPLLGQAMREQTGEGQHWDWRPLWQALPKMLAILYADRIPMAAAALQTNNPTALWRSPGAVACIVALMILLGTLPGGK